MIYAFLAILLGLLTLAALLFLPDLRRRGRHRGNPEVHRGADATWSPFAQLGEAETGLLPAVDTLVAEAPPELRPHHSDPEVRRLSSAWHDLVTPPELPVLFADRGRHRAPEVPDGN